MKCTQEETQAINKIINWSQVSRILTGDRTAIRANYAGLKYKRRVKYLIFVISIWVKMQNKYK